MEHNVWVKASMCAYDKFMYVDWGGGVWNIMCGAKIIASMCTYKNVYFVDSGEREAVLDLYTLSKQVGNV